MTDSPIVVLSTRNQVKNCCNVPRLVYLANIRPQGHFPAVFLVTVIAFP